MIIGLIGAPEAGKDAIANFFVEYKNFKRLAFADKIKNGFYVETGYNEEQFKLARGTALEQEIRSGLWKYSTKICNKYGPYYFIEQVINDIKYCKCDDVVVTDVRTDLELETLENYGAKMVLVLRNFKEELKGKILPGTKIELSRAIVYPKFWNILDSLDKTYIELDKFYKEL